MHRKPMFRTAVLVAFLLWLIPIQPVRADIAPPPPPEAGSIAPGQPTQVRMEAETVLVDITPTTGQGAPYARVTASFTMRNGGAQAEQMDVRFPLNLLYPHYQSDLEVCPYPEGGYPEISDFSARVDGQSARVTTLSEQVGDPDLGQTVQEVDCWASFPVAFPPGQAVLVEVSYTAEGYFAWNVDSLVDFPYVLATGAGWAGTIGQAEITIRAPFELNSLNLFGYSPDDAQVSGREVRWTFSDIEPTWNVSATIVNPLLWDRIFKERQVVADNPKDGEAWGRLGKAYKEANSTGRGYRWDEGGPELYRLAREAYETCLALLPRDADWHYGYSELLWRNVEFGSFGSQVEQRDDLVSAAEHLRMALAINPRHARALELLDSIATWWMWDPGATPAVDVSGTKPDFLILTTTPTARPEPRPIPSATPWPSPTLPLTASPPPPPTAPATVTAAATATPQKEATEAPTTADAAQASPAPANEGGGLCASAGLALGALAAGVVIRRRRSR